ncbi:alpha-glucuronidase [Actinoplanes sp. HUAS TT8]|uniref:alpha-glucuronidase n=1 Tax=Actinoplanes sp. HUAS TT8 TaxID=3447453 RepID=UPI003F5225BD
MDVVDPAWLPPDTWRAIGRRRIRLTGHGLLVDTVAGELGQACARFGGELVRSTGGPPCDVEMGLGGEAALGAEGFAITTGSGPVRLRAHQPHGLLYGMFHLLRLGDAPASTTCRPAVPRRMLDHWDNVDVHPVMGQVERGYAGSSLFWRAGAPRRDLTRVTTYARMLASCGINAVALNNVNVHATEARLLTDRLGEVAELAGVFRRYGIRTHLSVSFAAPVLHGLDTADPLDVRVRRWWEHATAAVYQDIPDFGGYLVKADSEGRPGPFTYGRTHADGANLLADALAPHGGVVHWRAFVYNHRQDWRDRSIDRARAAFDHFTPHDGTFRDNVVLQVKHGPMDFQAREPVSPLIPAMPRTRIGVEFQITQEYTGQQRHVCYLAPMWSELLRGTHGPALADSASEFVAVANVGDDPFWTGHPLAQANLYAFGRLAWDPGLDPAAVLDEWITLTFPDTPARLGDALHAIMQNSWATYERYTAPLGVGFMVHPGDHYGPAVDGYEYSRWGTYHHADRDGVGVDRTVTTGTGQAAQYPEPWRRIYDSRPDCPDELVLFFHHLPYTHVLRSGVTVIQHIYDTHFAGADEVAVMRGRWAELSGTLPPAAYERVAELLDEQVRSAGEWRDQVNSYFFRKSGVPDAHGRRIY